ncbi:MAG: HlyD family secretion protein [Rikenellaceae bacterium]|nr:HlyD family secretion protein [Rikenellaceae bacterium]
MELTREKMVIDRAQFLRDSMLHRNGVISPYEYEVSQAQHLQSYISYESMVYSINGVEIQLAQMQESLFDLQQQYTDKKNSFKTQLINNINHLKADLLSWEMTYVLRSPIKGKVTFTTFWVENQNISAGEEAFTVVPTAEQEPLGKALLPLSRSGKVEVGQRVNIRFENFPDTEFGMIRGEVKSISAIPIQVDGQYVYTIEIAFPNRLQTTYGKELPYLPHMRGQADIVTTDVTLLERFLMPLRKAISQGL